MDTGDFVTLIIDLSDDRTAALKAKAHEHGISAEEYARQVLEQDLESSGSGLPLNLPNVPRTGYDLVAALQASPCRDLNLEPGRGRMPVRDASF